LRLALLRPSDPSVRVVGEKGAPLRDLYHIFLLLSLPQAIGLIVAGILVINTIFALVYMGLGGVTNMAPGSFLDAFSFSMQTLATIGYGTMSPESPAAKLLSDAEAVVGLVVTALATGLLFTRFSRPPGTLRFTRNAVITQHDGQPTLIFRVGNERGNLIVEAQARVVLMRTETTVEGKLFYRMIDLPLVRDRSIHFTRSWTLMHRIDEQSPLHRLSAVELAAQEIEITCSIVGVDNISLQPTHGRHTWDDKAILIGYHLADLLRPLPDGTVEANVARFDEVEPDGS